MWCVYLKQQPASLSAKHLLHAYGKCASNWEGELGSCDGILSGMLSKGPFSSAGVVSFVQKLSYRSESRETPERDGSGRAR